MIGTSPLPLSLARGLGVARDDRDSVAGKALGAIRFRRWRRGVVGPGKQTGFAREIGLLQYLSLIHI